MYVLVLVFAMCCETSVTLPDKYPTLKACVDVGKVWMAPNANPTKTVLSTYCKKV